MANTQSLSAWQLMQQVQTVAGEAVNRVRAATNNTGIIDLGEMQPILEATPVVIRQRRRFRKERTIDIPVRIVGLDDATGALVIVVAK